MPCGRSGRPIDRQLEHAIVELPRLRERGQPQVDQVVGARRQDTGREPARPDRRGMLRRPDRVVDSDAPDKRMARALAVRVAVSVGLFLFIMLGWKLGWIVPHGLPVSR